MQFSGLLLQAAVLGAATVTLALATSSLAQLGAVRY